MIYNNYSFTILVEINNNNQTIGKTQSEFKISYEKKFHVPFLKPLQKRLYENNVSSFTCWGKHLACKNLKKEKKKNVFYF